MLGLAVIAMSSGACRAAAETDELAGPLSLNPRGALVPMASFIVGTGSSDREAAGVRDYMMPFSTLADSGARFVYQQLIPAQGWEAVLERLEVADAQTPWSITTTVRVPAPFDSPLLPFAAIAAENDTRADDLRRMGFGGGVMWVLGKGTTFGAEAVYFGGGRNTDADAFGREVRCMARLQITF